MNTPNSAASHRSAIRARRVQFDLSRTPLQWIPDDPMATHLLNAMHLLLPAGEFWFCRIYNKALPLITDPQLREQVQGFVGQEASHARAHQLAQGYLRRHGVNTAPLLARIDRALAWAFGDAPLGIKVLQRPALEKRWLILRVGLVAAIEHFTGFAGHWAMNSRSWERADPVMADLLRWHLAEEVEHRSVAFDVFEHLCRSRLGFYVSRQMLMAAVLPAFIYALDEATRAVALQDRSDPKGRRLARSSRLRGLIEQERLARRLGNMPAVSALLVSLLRWASPAYNPEREGNTGQALAYLARSPAARAAARA